jgi:hypothetical protein
MSYRSIRYLSLLLGFWMFLFGFLKFFAPFNGWFDTQIQQSHLPHAAILAGKVSEMITGVLFLLPWVMKPSQAKSRDPLLLLACLILLSQMVVAIYVHLQPGVPARVLPLGIKAPIIPATVLILDLITAFAILKQRRSGRSVEFA